MIAMLINPYVLYQSLNVPRLNGLFSWIDVASSDTSISCGIGFLCSYLRTQLTLPTDVITGLSLFSYQVM